MFTILDAIEYLNRKINPILAFIRGVKYKTIYYASLMVAMVWRFHLSNERFLYGDENSMDVLTNY